MIRDKDRPSPDEIRSMSAAADWLEQLDQPHLDESVLMQWLAWCDADSANREAFERMRQVSLLSQELADDLAPEVHTKQTNRFATANLNSRRLLGFAAAGFAAAASLALAVNLIGFSPGPSPVSQPDQAVHHELVRDSLLADGSELKLGPKSIVVVSYAPQQRAVKLEQGEAYFAVAPDPSRPFIVDAGSTQVRAVGTAFNVRRVGERVVVSVAEGVVKIYQGEAEADGILTSAGSQVSWGGDDENPVVTSVSPAQVFSWREGLLRYTNEPLSAVVADVNRYSESPLRIRGDGLETLRYSGLVRVNEISEWIQALPAVFPVDLRIEGDSKILQMKKES